MSTINKTTLKILSKQSEKVKKLITTKSNLTNIKELKYTPEPLNADIIEISQKPDKAKLKETIKALLIENKTKSQIANELHISRESLYKLLKKIGLSETYTTKHTPYVVIEKTELQALVNDKKTLNEMAQELNVSVSNVRHHLKKYNMANSELIELRTIRRYFSATTPEEKAKAFVDIDKYLEQIAKEKYELNKTTTFEDCLQDVRLNFFELAEKRENGNKNFARNLFNELRNSKQDKLEELDIVNLELAADKIDDGESLLQKFENNDFKNYLINSLQNPQEKFIIQNWVNEDKSFKKIAETSDLTPAKIRDIFIKGVEKIKRRHSLITSDKYLKFRANIGLEIGQYSK